MPQTLAMPALPAPKSSDLTDTLRARLALALMSGGIDTSPVQHWTQGAARVMQALVGGGMLGQLAEAEQARRAALAQQFLAHPAFRDDTSAPPSPSSAPASPATPGRIGAIPDDLRQTITTAASRYGIDPSFALTTARIESNFNPQAKSQLSSASGLFQFTAPTWQRYGQGGNIFDPAANADAAMRLARDNASFFRNRFGRDPSNTELYLLHQQGPAGAAALLSNPEANAIDALTPAYRGNRALATQAVLNNGGRPTDTAAEFAARIMQRASTAERQLAQAMPAAGQASAAQAPIAQTPIAQAPAAAAAPAAAQPTAMAQAGAAPQAAGPLPRPSTPLSPEMRNYIRQLISSGNEQAIAYGLQLLNESTKPQDFELIKTDDGRIIAVNKRTREFEELPIRATPKIVTVETEDGRRFSVQMQPGSDVLRLPKIEGVPSQQTSTPGIPDIPAPPPGADPKKWRETYTELAAKKAQTEPERRAQSELKGKIVTEDIDRAIKLADEAFLPVTGLVGEQLSKIPGTAARDVASLIDAIRANIGFEQLQKLREASPTGGALGPVSDRENQFLQSALGSLSQAQSPQQFRDNLRRIKNIFLDIVHGPGQGPPREKLSFSPQAETAPRIRRYNPETGKIE